MDQTEVTVIGAGVVGLAIAAELARAGREVVLLERHPTYGQETSSRNSEIIHAGIYYPPGSLKAALCVEGAARLYRYCEDREIPHARLGKLIVAAAEPEIPILESLLARGQANGVRDLRLLDRAETRALEPCARAVAGLHSPHTGILSVHGLMAQLYREGKAAGVLFAFGGEVDFLERRGDGFVVGLAGQDYRMLSRVVVNAAGLASDRVARMLGIDIDADGYRLQYCKGCYFVYQKPSPIRRLVYPVPHDDLKGLGVHATLDLGGCLRFGPDVEDVAELDYDVPAGKQDFFRRSAACLLDGLVPEAIVPGMAGIRPKLAGSGVRDFLIRHEADRGLPGAINLVGIESPGLTGCLAIAARVKELAAEAF
jgi:L-2-hydroxyglutarate oxidase LhgO